MRALFDRAPFPLKPLGKASTILVVDVSNLAHRYWHAPSFKGMTFKGKRTGHIFGFFKAIMDFIKASRGSVTLVFALDGYPEKRYNLYPEYKDNRDRSTGDPMPEITKLVKYIPGYTLHIPDWEADDAIASFISAYRKREARKGADPCDIRVITSDRDLYQLIDDNTSIWQSANKPRVTMETMKKDIAPEHVRMQKVLHGDKSDHIKGVPFLRKKDVLPAILKSDGTVRGFMRIAKKDCSKAVYKRLTDHKDVIKRNFRLVTLHICKVRPIPNKTSPIALAAIMVDEYGCKSVEMDTKRFF